MEFKSDDLNILIAVIRNHLYRSIYNNMQFIASINPIIAKFIPCESIDYNPDNYSFTLKINEETGIHIVQDIYNKIRMIFKEFIMENKDALITSLSTEYNNANYIYDLIMTRDVIFSALGNVSALSNNSIIIRL